MPRYQHPLEVYGLQTILDDGLRVEDLEVKDLLVLILMELKILNTHMSLITDEEIEEEIADMEA